MISLVCVIYLSIAMYVWYLACFWVRKFCFRINVKSQKYNAFLLPQGYTLTHATYNCNRYYDHYDKTRMHSSRLRTVRCSGRRGGLPQYMLGYTGVSAPMHAGIRTPLNRMTDRQVLKHYLSATSFADGKNSIMGNLVKWTQYVTVKFAWHFTGYFLSLILCCHQDKPLVKYIL